MLNIAKSYSDHPEGFEHLFDKALEIACNLPEGLPLIEIGTRAGGSALLFLYAIKESGVPRPLITIDPYGSLYRSGVEEYLDPTPPGTTTIPWYPPSGEEKYRNAVAMLSSFCLEFNLTHIHYRLHSKDWMSLWESFGCWIEGEQINKKLMGLVYLDGEHVKEEVEQELSWFLPRIAPGGLIIIDDVQHIRKDTLPNIQKAFEESEEDNLRLYWPVPTLKITDICKNGGKPKPIGDGKKIGTVYLHHHKETIEI